MIPAMLFARRVFLIAGILGLIQIVPMYFLESYLAQRMPPPLSHPKWYYGFLGVCFAIASGRPAP